MSSNYNLSKNKRITVFHTLKLTVNSVYDIFRTKGVKYLVSIVIVVKPICIWLVKCSKNLLIDLFSPKNRSKMS